MQKNFAELNKYITFVMSNKNNNIMAYLVRRTNIHAHSDGSISRKVCDLDLRFTTMRDAKAYLSILQDMSETSAPRSYDGVVLTFFSLEHTFMTTYHIVKI